MVGTENLISGLYRISWIEETYLLSIRLNDICKSTQSNFFAAGCKIMQHYVTNLYNIMQHYVIRGDISPHFRRLIAVNDRFCGDNLIGI